jgi:hypothetical protein
MMSLEIGHRGGGEYRNLYLQELCTLEWQNGKGTVSMPSLLSFFSLGFCSQKSVSCCTYDIIGADVSTVVLIDFYAIYIV